MDNMSETVVAKSRIAKALASSKRANIRNLESPFYILFLLWLQHLVRDHVNLLVAPQYTLWFMGEYNVEGNPPAVEINNEMLGTENEGDSLLADMSIDSIRSRHEANASNKIPDFVILHITVAPLPANEPRFNILEGIWVTGETCPLVMECKSLNMRVTRTASPSAKNIWQCVVLAVYQLQHSCQHAFGKYPGLQRLVAVATAGPYWTYAFVERDDVLGETWSRVYWERPSRRRRFYTMQFSPRDPSNDAASMRVRDFLMAYAQQVDPIPGAQAAV